MWRTRVGMWSIVAGLIVILAAPASGQMVGGHDDATAAPAASRSHEPDPPAIPEVQFPKRSPADVVGNLAELMRQNGYRLVEGSDYRAVFEKPGGLGGDMLVGAPSRVRIIYSIVAAGDLTTVTGEGELVGHAGSRNESVTPLEAKKHRRGIQSVLDALGARFAAQGQ